MEEGLEVMGIEIQGRRKRTWLDLEKGVSCWGRKCMTMLHETYVSALPHKSGT